MIRFDQINMHHAIHAADYLRRRMDTMQTDINLTQEPYFFKGIQGLGDTWNIHRGGPSNERARACIFSRKNINCTLLPQFSSNDFTTCLLKYHRNGKEMKLICCSAYQPYDKAVPMDGFHWMDFIASKVLVIPNEGNRPTFINSNREEVIDITLCPPNIFREVSNWHVLLEQYCPTCVSPKKITVSRKMA
jgi:hypothetical protein